MKIPYPPLGKRVPVVQWSMHGDISIETEDDHEIAVCAHKGIHLEKNIDLDIKFYDSRCGMH